MKVITLQRAILIAATLTATSAMPAASNLLGDEPPVATQSIAGWHASRLRPLQGHANSIAYAINAAGQVAGSSWGPALPVAVIWDAEGNPTALPPLPGHEASEAAGINDAGVVVGWSRGEDGRQPAVMWGRDGEPVELAGLPGHTSHRPRDINDAGVVVGTSKIDGLRRAVMWRPGEATVELSRLPGHPVSEVLAINSEGFMVGKSQGPADSESDGARTAIVWSPDGQGTALLPLVGHEGSVASAINDAGVVTGESFTGCAFAAWAWDRNNDPRALPLLADDVGGFPFGTCQATGNSAASVNESGIVVGLDASARSGVLWDLDGTPVALPPLPGDQLSRAHGINKAGVVVGFSRGDSGNRAVVWISR